jgi:hypothetical protein
MNFRKTITFMLVSALCAAFLLTSQTDTQAQKAMAEDCTQFVEATWLGTYTAEASTQGECGLGELTLTVRNQNGETEFSDTYGPSDLFGFYDIFTFQDMTLALTDWVSNYADESSTAKLPPWPEGAESPEAGEFPFYVEDGVSQALYEEVRAQDRRMICFIQGSESLLCLVQHPETGDLEALGVQSFPG